MDLETIHKKNLYITQDKLKESLVDDLEWIKRDYLLNVTSRNQRTLKSKLKSQSKTPRILSSHSDYGFNKKSLAIFKNVYPIGTLLFVTNLEIAESDFVRTFPIGLTNNSFETPLHKIFGNPEMLKNAFESNAKKTKQIISGFSTKTHKSRKLALKHSQLSKYVQNYFYDPTQNGRMEFLTATASSLAVVCPRGNGVDTHRIWETLYLGAIPIVKRGEYPKSLFNAINPPHLELQSWEELRSFDIIDKLLQVEWNTDFYNFLSVDFWVNKIKFENRFIK